MAGLEIDASFWKNKRVFLTGHTGFKGAWLSLWLNQMGAQVFGYALEPPTNPSLFKIGNVADGLAADHRADILDLDALRTAMSNAKPDIVFHMAAQSLVRESYRDPVYNYAANVMGTTHVLECVRHIPAIQAVVVITTDKCYENREWVHPYRETDPVGGADPYSSSKACAELVTSSFRTSFFSTNEPRPQIATARAGNVVGGGDWANDRLVPDCIRAFQKGESVVLRYPQAVRPWQHVLEPLSGYLLLAQQLCSSNGEQFAGAWNFGPDPAGEGTVLTVSQGIADHWGKGAKVHAQPVDPEYKESHLLRLDSTKARTELGWQPRWDLEQMLAQTVAWYRAWHEQQQMSEFTATQIKNYTKSAP